MGECPCQGLHNGHWNGKGLAAEEAVLPGNNVLSWLPSAGKKEPSWLQNHRIRLRSGKESILTIQMPQAQLCSIFNRSYENKIEEFNK